MSALFFYSLIVLALIFTVGRNLTLPVQLGLGLAALIALNGPTLLRLIQ